MKHGLLAFAPLAAVLAGSAAASPLAGKAAASLRIIEGDVFGFALFLASLLAAGWLIFRFRDRIGPGPAKNHNHPKATGSAPDEGDPLEIGERDATRRWFLRLGAVASAVVLIALVVGDPILVINTVALIMVAIAFLLIMILVPRGL